VIARRLLSFGSSTPDNVSATKLVRIRRGVVYVGRVPLSEVFWGVEGLEKPPAPVKRMLPKITVEEWKAACRIIVLVLSAWGGS